MDFLHFFLKVVELEASCIIYFGHEQRAFKNIEPKGWIDQ